MLKPYKPICPAGERSDPMLSTSFQAYYTARKLEALPDQDKLLPVYASSDIEVYPFQVAAAGFALRSPYQKGVILCDEAGMGKSHEAMLIVAQRWMEGHSRILLCIPNIDLLSQWIDLLDRCYTVPYVVLTTRQEWEANTSVDSPNGFEQNGIVITTYDFAADHEDHAAAVAWDLTVFEEANALSGVYQESSRQARALYRIAGKSFKLLLTGTPIEKNIMDLYGLIWFIDNTVLPEEQEFLARYLRRPENYPELSSRVSKYCFRTLRSQAKGCAKMPDRLLLTEEYTRSEAEARVYQLLYDYINKPTKLAFPEMEPYDLALRLLGLQGSSTAAITQTIKGVIRRLDSMDNAQDEIAELKGILDAWARVSVDAKAQELLRVLERGFRLMKKFGARKKAVIFTESVETQKMLAAIVGKKYKVFCYNGSADYSVIRRFKEAGEVLISTDNGARGFNLEESAFVIQYDLLYNTLKMEQRIDRCHRLGQQNDVLAVAFIDKENFADVRKLELASKRTLVSNGVFGISHAVIGGFSSDLDAAFDGISERMRTAEQVEADYQQTLTERADENRQLVASAEEILFTTFSKKLAEKVRLTPRYVEQRTAEMNQALWELAKWFFIQYNASHTDCFYEIDDAAQTITATCYESLPTLFYYWNGSRNRKYQSLKAYGMAKDFKPRSGRITFSSIIGQGILHELECADIGCCRVTGLDPAMENAEVGLYTVEIHSPARGIVKEVPILVGQTADGEPLTEAECQCLLAQTVETVAENEHKSPHWLKRTGRPHPLDRLVRADAMLADQIKELSPYYAEETERLTLETKRKKTALAKKADLLESQIKELETSRSTITGNRLELLRLDKQINQLRREYMSSQENQFFEAMQLDLELEEKIKALAENEKLTAKAVREFVVEVHRLS